MWFVSWVKRTEALARVLILVLALVLSRDVHRHFTQAVRLFDADRAPWDQLCFNKHRRCEMSRAKVIGSSDIEFHFSALCWGMKILLWWWWGEQGCWNIYKERVGVVL